jgi:hypothetical protein
MKRLLERLSQIALQTIRALAGYGDLVLAWLNGIAAHIFPTPIKVRATSPRRSPSRSRR